VTWAASLAGSCGNRECWTRSSNLLSTCPPRHATPSRRWSARRAIILTPLEAAPEPRNLRRLKAAVKARWGTVPLLDMLTQPADDLQQQIDAGLDTLGRHNQTSHARGSFTPRSPRNLPQAGTRSPTTCITAAKKVQLHHGVSADEFGDHGAESFARVLLQEVAGSVDHGMVDARRARDGLLQDGSHRAGDRIPVTERH